MHEEEGSRVAEWITVGSADEIGDGDATSFDVNGSEIAVARSGGKLFAFSDICTHRGCNLANGGEIDGTRIECECHGSVFDMGTGEVIEGPATEPIATFSVSDESGELRVEA
jgi:nitrite reductase/ring-hydroxylating ferredoxin subunit